MALLTVLKGLAAEMHMTLAAAHFDHGIRRAAIRERRLVESYSSRLNVPLLLGSGDVPAEARKMKKGIEETARLLRYGFLEEAAEKWQADAIATGHNRDDQTETILLHIIRGTGWRGITGIPVKRGIFIRPLLTCDRRELIEFLRERKVRYAIDRSNRDNRPLRNRIRNRLLPYLRNNFNPSVDETLLRMGENLREGWKALEKPIREIIPGKEKGGIVRIPLGLLDNLSEFQIYLMLDMILREEFDIFQDVGKTHFDAAKRLIREGQSGGRIDFPHGLTLYKEQLEVRFELKKKEKRAYTAHEEMILPGAGEYILHDRCLSITIDIVKPKTRNAESGSWDVFLASVRFPIRVRGRRAGDRMVPFGMKGRKKISDLFIDRKVPLHKRDGIPIFEDCNGIFWVPGVATDERTRVTTVTKRIVHIRLIKRDTGER